MDAVRGTVGGRRRVTAVAGLSSVVVIASGGLGAEPTAPPGQTTLSHPAISHSVIEAGHITLERGPLKIVVADNRAYGDTHRAGYNGVSELRHRDRDANMYVSKYAGLNLEHIHDGSSRMKDRKVFFEPRNRPMQLRRINTHTVELHQPPTPTWKVESCTRFELLDDGVIEMTFHCIATEGVYKHGYVGFFWASYIDWPESKAITFRGYSNTDSEPRWITAFTPRHGVLCTHRAHDDTRVFGRDDELPAGNLLFGFSRYRYTEPFYFGTSHGMALVYMFRPEDRIRMTQSPTGGGRTNPAWDFQWFIPDVKISRLYGFKMRAAYLPRLAEEEIAALARRHITEMTSRNR